jgi:hypothetical protein
MTLNIPANYYEAAFEHSLAGSTRPAVCTIGLHYTGGAFSTDIGFVALAWAQHVMLSVQDSWTFTDFRARDALGSVANLAQAVTGGTSHTGTTPNVAFLMKKLTGLGGRANHGRLYLPGVSEQDVDVDGTVAGSKLTELTTNFGAFATDCAAKSFFLVILHNGTAAPTPMTQFLWEGTAATQRRRLRK